MAAKPGSVAPSPVGLIDLYPTLAELCAVKPPFVPQGQSLVSILRDPAAIGRGWTISQVARSGAAIRRADSGAKCATDARRFFGYSLRTARWRYTEWDEGREGRELYDHTLDPSELTNLANVPSQAAVVGELSAVLRQAVKTTFPADGKTPELRPEMWMPNLTKP